MHVNLIAAAVPVFFVAIIAEALVDRSRRTGHYRFGTAIADLEVGVASSVADVFLRGVGVAIYTAVYPHRLFDFAEGSPWPWVIGLVGIDFLYYWWHRASHLVNVLWAVHAVHHQSEDFNFAVALRQPAFEALTIIPFHLPLALLGVDPFIYASSYAIDLIYQFWIHTELAGRLGWLEYVLNTPSSHRVHHGINRKYLDRNYGGILVIWDRLFGSYQPEEDPPAYGVTHALRSYNPIWANVAPFHDLAVASRLRPGFANKLRVWFAHPASLGSAEEDPGISPTRAAQVKYQPKTAPRMVLYVFAHFALLTAAGGAFMNVAERGGLMTLIAPGALLLVSALSLTAWIERRRWALALDGLRQVALIVLAAVYLVPALGPTAGIAIMGGLAAILAIVFAVLRPDSEAAATKWA
jgi:sterol desaturase/sphingolipid hydroxylase (fatty acid hydroxylase superfamily)